MNEIQIFNSDEFGSVRIAIIDGEPWFVGKDVAICLGYAKPLNALSAHVDSEDKKMGPQNGAPSIVDKLGRQQYPTFINESGFYTLVLSSKLPSAQKFKHWVTNDVLPSIRKHGAYMTTETMAKAISDPDFTIGLLQALKAEQEKSKDLAAKIERDKPMVDYAKLITAAEYELSVGDFAKLLRKGGAKDMGQNRLFQRFRDEGYLQTRKSEWNVPTQTSIEAGLFSVSVVPIRDTSHFARKTMVTPKGQSYFIAKYL